MRLHVQCEFLLFTEVLITKMACPVGKVRFHHVIPNIFMAFEPSVTHDALVGQLDARQQVGQEESEFRCSKVADCTLEHLGRL
jgi:hypothetical protein